MHDLIFRLTSGLFLIATALHLARLRYKIASDRVLVFVLGDFGRSPRMQYHTRSLLKHNFIVDVICYANGNIPLNDLINHPRLTYRYIPQPAKILATNRTEYLARAVARVICQILSILWLLMRLEAPSRIFVQNPPAIPTLLIGTFAYRLLTQSKLIVDWHNFGYSILAISQGKSSVIVRFSEWYERCLGGYAHAHFTVTNAMRLKLRNEWHFSDHIQVFYDKAPQTFHRLDLDETHALFSSIQFNIFNPPLQLADTTLITHRIYGVVCRKSSRPVILVTSTSFTEDEDLSILLDAMVLYDQKWTDSMPNLVVIVTGKGPLQEMYRVKIKRLVLKHVTIKMMWLEIGDYPKLLGSVDLGLSFHSSSSGLDLPMKIVDLFGCGTPVLALDYQCISELVSDGVNGLLFSDAQGLHRHLQNLLTSFPNNKRLDALFKGVMGGQESRWDAQWTEKALPYFQD